MRLAALILALGVLQATPSLEVALEGAFEVSSGATRRRWRSEVAFTRLPVERALVHVLVRDELDEARFVCDDVLEHGSVWIEESTSRIFEAEVKAADSSLRVSFGSQPGLDILVPLRMREIFPFRSGRGNGDARYSNFRRFATAARIVPQP